MLFEAAFQDGDVCEYVSESFNVDEAGGAVAGLITFRVKNAKEWAKLVPRALRELADHGERFGFTIRKEFYLNEEEEVLFAWAVYLWARSEEDLSVAAEALQPYLGARAARRLRPQPTDAAPPAGPAAVRTPKMLQKFRVPNAGEGSKTITRAPLARRRDKPLFVVENPDKTVKPSLPGSGDNSSETAREGLGRMPRVHVVGLDGDAGRPAGAPEDEI